MVTQDRVPGLRLFHASPIKLDLLYFQSGMRQNIIQWPDAHFEILD